MIRLGSRCTRHDSWSRLQYSSTGFAGSGLSCRVRGPGFLQTQMQPRPVVCTSNTHLIHICCTYSMPAWRCSCRPRMHKSASVYKFVQEQQHVDRLCISALPGTGTEALKCPRSTQGRAKPSLPSHSHSHGHRPKGAEYLHLVPCTCDSLIVPLPSVPVSLPYPPHLVHALFSLQLEQYCRLYLFC